MSRLIRLARDMYQFIPTADHEYVPAFSVEEQTTALAELLEAYPGASGEEKKAIEHGFFHVLDMQPDTIHTPLLQLVKAYKNRYAFVQETLNRLQPTTACKKALKK